MKDRLDEGRCVTYRAEILYSTGWAPLNGPDCSPVLQSAEVAHGLIAWARSTVVEKIVSRVVEVRETVVAFA